MATSKTQAGKVDPSNPMLAQEMISTIKRTGTDPRKGMCQKAVRETIQDVYGETFDGYHKGTAHLSMLAWKKSKYAVIPNGNSVIGDILYQKGTISNPAGHVGIRVAGNRVGENSSRRAGRVRGAYGFVSLAAFGKVDLIVRLPRPKK